LQRKIEIVTVLLDRFQEKLECVADLPPSEMLLERAEMIRNDFVDMAALIEELKKQIYSKKSEQSN